MTSHCASAQVRRVCAAQRRAERSSGRPWWAPGGMTIGGLPGAARSAERVSLVRNLRPEVGLGQKFAHLAIRERRVWGSYGPARGPQRWLRRKRWLGCAGGRPRRIPARCRLCVSPTAKPEVQSADISPDDGRSQLGYVEGGGAGVGAISHGHVCGVKRCNFGVRLQG